MPRRRTLLPTLPSLLLAGLIGLIGQLTGCATATPPAAWPPVPPADERFGPPGVPIDADEVFALSPAMRQYLAAHLPHTPQDGRRPTALVQALNTRGELKLEYDASLTRTAAQAFEARAGNCLSLVIMTAALAKAQGIQVTYNLVHGEQAYSREGGLLFTSGHVNLTLGRPLRDRQGGYDQAAWLTVDFLPGEDITGQRREPIPESTIVAMFMNNRAAEAMAQHRLADAHAYAREALRHSPGYGPARNTLAVVYLRRGLPADAEPLLRTVLAAQPTQRDALDNLRLALLAQGRGEEAAAIARQLAALEPEPPFQAFDRGLAAMQQQDYAAARTLFQREIDRHGCLSTCHYWLAMAELRLGHVAQARQALQIARDTSAGGAKHALYAAKLERLNGR